MFPSVQATWLFTLAMVAAACLDTSGVAPRPTPTPTRFGGPDLPTTVENLQPGTRDWLTTNLANQTGLAVWAAPYAVTVGDTLTVFIHATSGPVGFLPSAFCLLPSAYCLLPTTYCFPPTAFSPGTRPGSGAESSPPVLQF